MEHVDRVAQRRLENLIRREVPVSPAAQHGYVRRVLFALSQRAAAPCVGQNDELVRLAAQRVEDRLRVVGDRTFYDVGLGKRRDDSDPHRSSLVLAATAQAPSRERRGAPRKALSARIVTNAPAPSGSRSASGKNVASKSVGLGS